jgi:sucrose phosphorylase
MNLQEKFEKVYGEAIGKDTYLKCLELIERFAPEIQSSNESLSENDAILITYGDQVQAESGKHLACFHGFYNDHVKSVINSVHFLPFFPYTSDDGFSVVDYFQIDPEIGTWEDVKAMSKDARLMFDAVVNHISKSSDWFQGYLNGDPEYEDFFIDVDPKTDLSKVVRPRALPLLTPFEGKRGKVNVWSTFSEDQIDINAANPKVLLKVLEALLVYAQNGARLIRLDAIAFLWKEIGTSCLHLENTHLIVKIFRDVLEEVCPDMVIITETNVPHTENISYFGNGHDEAHMVYNFTLSPLLAWSLHRGHAKNLTAWAKTLKLDSSDIYFFNFTASHDGIGMRPLQGILPTEEVDFLGNISLAHGGQVSYKNNSDGTKSPYELNCNYMDFLTPPDADLKLKIQRFLCSQAVMISMPGVPGIYFHSLFGSANDPEGVKITGRARSINRKKFKREELEAELKTDPRRSQVFEAYQKMLKIRKAEKAFHPKANYNFLELHPGLFSILRYSLDQAEKVLCIFNLSESEVEIQVDQLPFTPQKDLLNQAIFEKTSVKFPSYCRVWLK